ncbi:MAG: bifunctional aldolase/short-chain dehydrogenase [Chloroflexi bacterium]|nr:bifunctional aldolase/short-chain dehydrogenase [Chloroflexota bacterium]
MKSRWDNDAAREFTDDPLALRAYSSRLLGADPNLVLHGGGNTSVKLPVENLHGESEEILYVKGSGWDLADIEPPGFAPLRLDAVRRLAGLDSLDDTNMMRSLRAASINPDAPNPSVETITHALIPHQWVDHTHADAIVTISNTPNGDARLLEVLGDEVLIVPYAMPGFILAKLVAELVAGVDWSRLDGMILMNHGVFTFGNTAQESYERMIALVTRAECVVSQHSGSIATAQGDPPDLKQLAELRRAVSTAAGFPQVARVDSSDEAVGFSLRDDVSEIATRGGLTPDHVIHTKPSPMVLSGDVESDIADFQREYKSYFGRYSAADHQILDAAPRWAVWRGVGTVSFGPNAGRASVVADIAGHNITAAQIADSIDAWQPLGPQDLFDVEYWVLEQAKLKRIVSSPPLQGKIALVTGAASGIGAACVCALRSQGAAVACLDIDGGVIEQYLGVDTIGIQCDVTSSADVDVAVDATIGRFGGLDIVISNAGTFPAGMNIEEMDDDTWTKVVDVNMSGHMRVIRAATPYLKFGIDPAIVAIASKNVPAPGPGAAAYSAAKAGLTQLARVAALELGELGVRVNVLHPNAVFDTGIWTEEVLQNRADHYGITVDQYKTNNVLGVEVTSKDVANLAVAMAGPLFSRTTGAQLPVDGGNDRVI